MDRLPEWMFFNGTTYYLHYRPCTQTLNGWHSYFYSASKEGSDIIPPYVTDGKFSYYLISCDPVKEQAYDDLLDRVNRMKPWLIKHNEQ